MMGTYSGGYKDEQAGFSSLEELLFNWRGKLHGRGRKHNQDSNPASAHNLLCGLKQVS